ncbi:ribosome biogenesis GTP-binding protein YsxC [Sphingobacterium spiritivorum ATCC 33300]|uniref:Probable GTP-binding protein EngB n=1 Tax=Sphingobacterium spiritivorum ATCC 33300 TaxID=525372 RepID=C2G3Z1_SPHSI|nr:ribosome biogenesis GTP-binding protein YihA/YsxC [Sphingobacterium spiritivorum]EEI90084.1 ribosome biogenesis GTP-binding protein YsxC [Sphingobacterium spiritivorum ATCC 33300]QQS95033.1 YihA family ribosome biogenesis GTP-binding protein [Sphingobacterium spiritivorum]
MLVKKAEFVCSNTRVDKLPDPTLPEYAFIGRSNVGKSSLINAMTNKKGLAKTSQKPGKTQLINHFIINDEWFLVDLPGYGFAQTSKTNRSEWQKFIRRYLTHRDNLQCVFVLIDSRHEPQKIDLDFCCWLGECGLPFMLVFTKADKQSAVKSDVNIAKFRKSLLQWFEEVPPHFLTSAEAKTGCEPILEMINDINTRFVPPEVDDKF